ncbi:conserved exported hypothetical protein [Candidatus Sulfopaludibacter sp. SbA3]|nr:conserved exported hypothetical protein [Candidatus Sulfopaludibacter sp. SbA3]
MRALLLLCAAACFAQQPADPGRVLARAQAQLAAAAADVPKYTCRQTVDRSYFRETRQIPRACDTIVANQRNGRSKLALAVTDRLRFDVEVADGGYEIYAWPGAARIETEKVEDMAGGGPLGTGPFGPFLVDIFANPAVQFQYLDKQSALFEYRYRVPLGASHYRVQAGPIWRTTAYDGTFRLDPESAELKQLTVRTAELPADTATCEATTVMDFEKSRIGAGEYLIPRQTRLQTIGRDASYTENATVYAECREFRGESVVHFDQAIPQADTGPKLSVSLPTTDLPPGMPIILALDTEIDTDHAAAGDAISAKVGKPVVDPATKRVLVQAGSIVHGRITHMEHHIEGEGYFLVGVSFDMLEPSIPLAIMLDRAHQIQDPRASSGRRVVTTESRSGFHGGGTFVFPTRLSRYVVPRGYSSNWITIPGG